VESFYAVQWEYLPARIVDRKGILYSLECIIKPNSLWNRNLITKIDPALFLKIACGDSVRDSNPYQTGFSAVWVVGPGRDVGCHKK